MVVSAWLATRPGAEQAQTGLVRWFNDPRQPVAAVFSLVNPLFRPWPLLGLTAVLLAWVLLSAPTRSERWEIVRAAAVAYGTAEVMAQLLKRIADQPRPLAVVPELDTHGYPTSPHGNAFPSAHTAVAVAIVAGLWPWMRRPQRIAGAVLAMLLAGNRIYIGAHWPLDVLGGAAIGLVAGSSAWLVAARWPVNDRPESTSGGRRARRADQL